MSYWWKIGDSIMVIVLGLVGYFLFIWFEMRVLFDWDFFCKGIVYILLINLFFLRILLDLCWKEFFGIELIVVVMFYWYLMIRGGGNIRYDVMVGMLCVILK